MDISLPDDGPEVDPWDRLPPEWDYASVIPDEWCWSAEAVQAYRLQTGWGPR